MKKMKSTKRALLMSVLSLLLCCSMLIGTTFAWFSDSVTSVNNKIVAGNLDVELEYYDGDSWEKVTETTNVFENSLWEPGHTEVVYLKVSNLGTLALKYALNINIAKEIAGTNVAGESFKLSDYIVYDIIESKTSTIYDNRDEARKAAADDDNRAEAKLKTAYVNVDNLLAEEEADYVTMVVYMPETVGNEANYKTGTTAPEIDLGINLYATQYTYEKDSFDNRYDGEAFVPVADVDALGEQTVTLVDDTKLPLDASFSFKTTEDEVAAAASGYRYWHADFVVYADKDIAANTAALAGYYDAYAKFTNTEGKWIALQSNEVITAGTEIRLLDFMGYTGNYEELCQYIPEFLCGVADLSTDGSNAGTTLTVELRLYETTIYSGAESGSANIETGKYITIGTYSYTFPTVKVTAAEDLQKALDNAVDGDVISIVSDIEGDVTVTQKPGVKVTIEGNNKNFAGVLTVDGKSKTYTTAGLTIQNVNFVAESINADACIRLGDGTTATRYTCNVTVSGCTFDVPGAVGVKSYTGGDKNLIITDCVATANAHSLVQAKGIDGVLVENCRVYSKNGLNFNNSDNVTVSGCTVDTEGYAVRFGESSGGSGAAEDYAIENCTLMSANNEGDATIILRGTADNATLTISNTTIVGNPKIANTANATVIVDNAAFVSTDDGLEAVLSNPNVTNISIDKDITDTVELNGVENKNINVNGHNVALTVNGEVKNVTITGIKDNDDATPALIITSAASGELTVKDSYFYDVSSQPYGAIAGNGTSTAMSLNIDGCTIEGARPLYLTNMNNLTVTNTTFKGVAGGSWAIILNGTVTGNIVIDGCTFENCTGILKAGVSGSQDWQTGKTGNVTFTNNTLNNNNLKDGTFFATNSVGTVTVSGNKGDTTEISDWDNGLN